MRDVEIGAALERIVPHPTGDADWEAVLRDVRPARRRVKPLAVSAFAAAAAAVALAVLLWPSSPSGGGILDRALAAIGDGPVLHVVLSEGWGGTVVDLGTGERTRLRAERELWYDAQRGMHEISRLGGVIEDDALVPPGKLTADRADWVRNFAGGYRRALETGTARVSGTDVVDGIPVYWINVHRELLPDVADGKLHELAQQVAVSRETYEPVATRDTRDGETGPDGLTRVLSVETRTAGEGDFRQITPSLDGVHMRFGPGPELTRGDAEGVLGRPALWPGREVAGLALATMVRFDYGVGETSGEAVLLQYGDEGGKRLELTESAKPSIALRRGVIRYWPPDGSIILLGTHIASMRQDGLYLSFEGSSEELILAAARALEPMR